MGHLYSPLDSQGVGLGDAAFAVELSPDGSVVSAEEAAELRLAARFVLDIERIVDGPQGAGHTANFTRH